MLIGKNENREDYLLILNSIRNRELQKQIIKTYYK